MPGVLTSSLARAAARGEIQRAEGPGRRKRGCEPLSGIRRMPMTLTRWRDHPDAAGADAETADPWCRPSSRLGRQEPPRTYRRTRGCCSRLPSGATSNARMRRCGQASPRSASRKQRSSSRLIATYSTDSSGENASPLGYSHSSVARCRWPVGSMRKTPENPISRSSAGRRSPGVGEIDGAVGSGTPRH